jgi:uncharacterized membrane protein YeaQ/YmgE (transglycosylase-associated protein family)
MNIVVGIVGAVGGRLFWWLRCCMAAAAVCSARSGSVIFKALALASRS